jgi:hypothetical protein
MARMPILSEGDVTGSAYSRSRVRNRAATSRRSAGMSSDDKPAALSSYESSYDPERKSDYLYRPIIGIGDMIAWQEATGRAGEPTVAEYVSYMIDKAGSYEAYLNVLTARDRRSGYSLGAKGEMPWWAAGDENAYHRAVRANQRRFDGQPPVDEESKTVADMTAGVSGSENAAAAVVTYVKDNKGIIIGAAALLALVLLARKR